MINKENIIFVPGTIQYVKNYEGYKGLDIWMKKNLKILPSVECLIGHSLGASFILKDEIRKDKNYILINPLVEKRSFPVHFINWIIFLIFEGFAIKKAVPMKYWGHTFRQVMSLLKIDVLGQMKKIPKENIFIIRGKYDDYFCDKENVKILKANDFKLIEVEAGHDWNENVARAVRDITIRF